MSNNNNNNNNADGNNRFDFSRRSSLKLFTAGAIGVSSILTTEPAAAQSVDSDASTAETPAEELYAETFESYSVETVPSEFELAGNTDQGIVAAPVATGERAYRMSGSHGGCWEAIARIPVPIEDQMRIRGKYRVTAGEGGCHDKRRGNIKLTDTVSGSWTDGNNTNVLRFGADDIVTSAGAEIGEYEIDEWVSFELIYQRDTETGEVRHKARINGGEWNSATRDEHSSEDEFTALELHSSDFTVIWDELVIEEYVEDSADPATFTIRDVSPGDVVTTYGETVEVTATIQNTGEKRAVQTVAVRIDTDGDGSPEPSEMIESIPLELDPGDSTSVAFPIRTSTLPDDATTYAYGFFTEDDSSVSSLTIESTGDTEGSRYTDEDGYVTSEGLLDAGSDYRNGEIGEDKLNKIASAFRSGEPLS